MALSWNVSVVVPKSWCPSDPDPATRAASTAAAVDRRIAADPELAGARRELIDILLGFAETADEKGALVAATLWEPGDYAPTVANVMVLAAATPEPPGIDTLVEALARPAASDAGPRDVQEMQLPAGPAVRLRLLTATEGPPDEPSVVLDAIQHWIPVPGCPGEAAVVSSSTPCLDVGDALATLSDEIAISVRFEEP